ncbi:phosphatase PAP2 family protein [Virgibacillus dokdonensis]|uniref:Phosphatase PAP2 family protein n=1 Tax=Virgibacillus dokdonensis TaxID=302167 RepID=A0ABU7VBE1_9BACI
MKVKKDFSWLFIFVGIIFMILFGIVSLGVFQESTSIENIDLAIIEVIQTNVTDTKTAFLSILSEIGNIRLSIALTIAFVIFLFIKRWYLAGFWLGGTVLCFAAIGTKLIKKVMGRARPNILPLIEKTTESFPSGHATSATIFYGILGLVLILLTNKYWKKTAVGLAVLVLIGFILMTRIYLGVHFPTDVIGGFLYGMATVFISVGIYKRVLEPLQQVLLRFNIQDRSISRTEGGSSCFPIRR